MSPAPTGSRGVCTDLSSVTFGSATVTVTTFEGIGPVGLWV